MTTKNQTQESAPSIQNPSDLSKQNPSDLPKTHGKEYDKVLNRVYSSDEMNTLKLEIIDIYRFSLYYVEQQNKSLKEPASPFLCGTENSKVKNIKLVLNDLYSALEKLTYIHFCKITVNNILASLYVKYTLDYIPKDFITDNNIALSQSEEKLKQTFKALVDSVKKFEESPYQIDHKLLSGTYPVYNRDNKMVNSEELDHTDMTTGYTPTSS